MKALIFENALQRILKKLLLVVMGSGLIGNALYIYGLAYYEGYIESLGFEYNFFPIKWEETPLWTYFASRELGASTVIFWTKITIPVIVLILVMVYFIARIWMAINSNESPKNPNPRKNTTLARFLVRRRRASRKIFNVIYPPIRWLLIMEQSVWAFLASYFFLIFLFFIPIFIFVWVYFPLIGLNHGSKIGAKKFEQYKQELCGNKNDYWGKCLTFTTSHLKDKNLPLSVRGRIVAKNGTLIALLSEAGPITMTMPPIFYQSTEKNPCFKGTCQIEEKTQSRPIPSATKPPTD